MVLFRTQSASQFSNISDHKRYRNNLATFRESFDLQAAQITEIRKFSNMRVSANY